MAGRGQHAAVLAYRRAGVCGVPQAAGEARVPVADRTDAFVPSFLAFSQGTLADDARQAPGQEIGRPGEHYRRIRLLSDFGKTMVAVSDGHLPYPYGRDTTGDEVEDLQQTLDKSKAAGVQVLVAPFAAQDRRSAVVEFPGGYVAEIHSPLAH